MQQQDKVLEFIGNTKVKNNKNNKMKQNENTIGRDIDIEKDKCADRQTGRQIDRQRDRETGKESESEREGKEI